MQLATWIHDRGMPLQITIIVVGIAIATLASFFIAVSGLLTIKTFKLVIFVEGTYS